MTETRDKVLFANNPVTLLGEPAVVGQVAPDFVVLDKALNEVRLSDYKGKVVAISVFPSIDTGICSIQAGKFNSQAGELGDQVVTFTISADLPFALGRYCATEGIDNAMTLSDHRDLSFGEAYGFIIKELRLLARGVVVIDKNGIISYVEYVPEVTTHANYDAAFDAIKKCI